MCELHLTVGIMSRTAVFKTLCVKGGTHPKFPADFFRCCITSPPYWGLRDYNAAGQIGAEDDPHGYITRLVSIFITRLVSIFEEVRRVLTADGTLCLNIGDSYTSGNRGYRAPDKK